MQEQQKPVPSEAPEVSPRDQVRRVLFESQALRITDPDAAYRAARKVLRMARAFGLPRLMIMGLIEMGWHHINRGDFAGAMRIMEQGTDVHRAIPDDAEMQCRLGHYLGSVHLYQGDVPKAVELFEQAVEFATGYNAFARAEALGSLALAYQRLGDYPRAIEIFTTIQAIWESERQPIYLMMTLAQIGEIYRELEEWERSLDAFFKCRDLAEGIGTRMEKASAIASIGHTLASAGRTDEALENLLAALELEREFERRQNEAAILTAIAEIYSRREMIECGQQHGRAALEIYEAIGEYRGLAQCLTMLGELHVLAGAHADALPLLERAIAIAQQTENRETEYRAQRTIANAHEQLGDTRAALEHYKDYMRLEKDLRGNDVRRAVANVQMRADLDKMARERELLRLKAERLELDIAHKERELTSAALHLAQKSQLLSWLGEQMAPFIRSRGKDASELVRSLLPQIRESADGKAQWQAFEEQFRQVHPDMIRMLLERYPTLTQTELKVCSLMKINLTTKEIADILCTSTRTVEGHRRFIRKKMDLPRDENLYTYLATLT
jgi:tetratricopeptide (TPR) repeat protein/DNA-binding CsgD family transcriptional regulator